MLNQLKTDEFYGYEVQGVHHDAHIKDYQSQKLGIKVVLCDAEGIPVYESVAPMSSYIPKTAHNM